MTKRVKITVSGRPITSTSMPLVRGTHGPAVFDEKDIFKCLVAGARVVEVTPMGKEIVLTLSNYNKDNTPEEELAQPKPEVNDVLDGTVYESGPSDGEENIDAAEEDASPSEDAVEAEEDTAVEAKEPATTPQNWSSSKKARRRK